MNEITLTTENDRGNIERCPHYAIRFWLPILGPTATILRPAMLDELHTNGRVVPTGEHLVTRIELEQLAWHVGITYQNVVTKAIERGARCGYWTAEPGTIHVPARVPRVPARVLRKHAGGPFQDRHDAYVAALGA